MNMWLTRGMFGKKEKLLAENILDTETVMRKLTEWKDEQNGLTNYKIEKYDRLLFGKDGVAVDFGDYSWFILIDGDGFEEIESEMLKNDIG